MSKKKRGRTNPVGISSRPLNKGYGDAGASHHKKSMKGFDAQSGSPQEDIDFNNYTLRQRARMLYMAAPVATGAVKTNRTNVVGTGLRLKSKIDRDTLGMTVKQAEAWQKNTEREFALWSENKKNCDATGVNNFAGMQQLALMGWLLSGDCIGLFKYYDPCPLNPYGLRLHIIEADRVSTPVKSANMRSILYTTGTTEKGNRIYDGVEVDSNGMIQAYHIRNNYPFQLDGFKQGTKWIRVQAYGEKTGLPNLVHVMDSERADQYRGVSYLAPVIEPLLQLRRYTESELTAAIVESFFTAFVTTETDPSRLPMNTTGEILPDAEDNEYEMGPGQINVMKQGEDIKFAEPKRPAGGFDAFVNSICTQMGSALELPVDILLKKYNSSYSAARAALMESWKAFRMRRTWFSDDFCQPVYEVWMSEAVARGRISAPGFFTDPISRKAYTGSEWIGPSQGMLDPIKEINAERLAVAEGYTTHEDATIRLNGGSWESNMQKKERENEIIRAAGGRGNKNGKGEKNE